jgi:hypothetical protein
MVASYKSSIPRKAAERVVERYAGGAKKKAEYRVGRELVGVRHFHETGEPDLEYALRGGERHGVEYRWGSPGRMTSAIPYAHGVGHGTAKQWGDDGRPLGTYKLVRGTGIDLWRDQREDGSVYLAEAFHWRDGNGDGFEWWLNEDQKTVWIEQHWRDGELHGIERQWNERERLHRGFPRYNVCGQRVTKRQYLRACRSDPTLPPFREADNRPRRAFPAEIAKHLHHAKK